MFPGDSITSKCDTREDGLAFLRLQEWLNEAFQGKRFIIELIHDA